MKSGYAPISDYALIGDCHGSALVRTDGTIDWGCLTRFDSGGVFSALLDVEKGGAFRLAVRDLVETRRRYLEDTNVLETTFVTSTGEAVVLDCFVMRRGGRTHPLRQLVRSFQGRQGHVEIEVCIEPRFDYGSLHPWLRHHGHDHHVYSAIGGDDAVVISSDCPLSIDGDAVALKGSFVLRAKRKQRFSLTAADPFTLELETPSTRTFDARLRYTIRWWQSWTALARDRVNLGPEEVRSLLVLKLLTCAPTGAIIAAPTTSLPESLGGTRNWDYRYSWIRDATMTLSALFTAGHHEAAARFRRFIGIATAGRVEDLQILYGCYGERRLAEVELDHLEGYAGSRPVRVGNAAMNQLQLDVYGELLDAAHMWLQVEQRISHDEWMFLHAVVETAGRRWREPDRGLWEMRGEPQHFVYSKAMCWLALARGLTIAERYQLPCDIDRWRNERDELQRDIIRHGVDEGRGCFVQAYGSHELDASLLRLPIIGFVEPNDPRMLETVDAIRADLAEGPLIRRYRSGCDGLEGDEGAFLMASFWLVDVLSMQGRAREAEELYRQLLAFGNDVGLFSEERDLRSGAALGNFPQAFTHVALIAAAQQVRRAESGTTARSLAERHH